MSMDYQLWERYAADPAIKRSLYRNHQWLRVIERIARRASDVLDECGIDLPEVLLLRRVLRRRRREDARRMRILLANAGGLEMPSDE